MKSDERDTRPFHVKMANWRYLKEWGGEYKGKWKIVQKNTSLKINQWEGTGKFKHNKLRFCWKLMVRCLKEREGAVWVVSKAEKRKMKGAAMTQTERVRGPRAPLGGRPGGEMGRTGLPPLTTLRAGQDQ